MKMTKQEADAYWSFSISLKIFGKVFEHLLFEKMPRIRLKNPALNNHIRKVQESADFIRKEAAYSLKDINPDYNANHSFALYRIFNSLHLSTEEELFGIANDLETQAEHIDQLVDPAYGNLHKELMTEVYSLKEIKEKERLLKYIKKIKREKKEPA